MDVDEELVPGKENQMTFVVLQVRTQFLCFCAVYRPFSNGTIINITHWTVNFNTLSLSHAIIDPVDCF